MDAFPAPLHLASHHLRQSEELDLVVGAEVSRGPKGVRKSLSCHSDMFSNAAVGGVP